MQLSIIATVMALATGIMANNCTPGLKYCGRTLNAVGKYQPQIDQALHDNGLGGDGGDVLFFCVGGTNGVISYLQVCGNGCHDGGRGNNDFCN